MSAGARVEDLFFTEAAARNRADLLGACRGAGIRMAEVSGDVMAHLTSGTTAPDVLAVAGMPVTTLGSLRGARAGGVLLCGVHDPATAGSIVATAAGTGCPSAVFARGTADAFRPSTVRAGQGGHFVLSVVRGVTAGEAIDHARAQGVRVVALTTEGPPPWDVDLSGHVVLSVGSDPDAGGTSLDADATVAVPARGVTPSLSARAAVVLYEWARQRSQV